MVELLDCTKTCNRCEVTKPSDAFGRNSAYADGKQATCKDCLNTQARERRKNDPEYARRTVEQSRAWQLRNKEEYEARRKAYRELQWATDPEGWREKTRRWSEKHSTPEARRKQRLKTKYGLTPEDYATLLAAQDGRCGICLTDKPGGPWDTFAVDHCHKTGQVRGLLCSTCNMGIGLLGDSTETIESALHYLKEAENG